jgi:hypothetical protein
MVNLGLPAVEIRVTSSGDILLAGRWLAWLALGQSQLMRKDIALVAFAEAPHGDPLQTIGGLAIVSESAGLFLLWGPKAQYQALIAAMEGVGLPVSPERFEWRRLQPGTFNLVQVN